MRRRLTLAITAVATAAVILFAIPLAIALQRSYRDEELLRLERDTVAATRALDLSQAPGDRIELPRFRGGIGIYSPRARRIVGAGPATGDHPVSDAIRSHRPAGTAIAAQLVVAIPLFSGERLTGAVRAQRSQAAVAARTRRAWLQIAGLGAGVIALTIGAAIVLGRRLARPLEALTAVAQRVGDGDFAARAAPSSMSEFDQLGNALNASSRRIGHLVEREREFSANASHQLRTPLAALRLELEAALLQSPYARRPELETALTQVDRLENTIRTLLAHARERHPTSERSVGLSDAAQRLETRWRGRLASLGRPLRVHVDARDPTAKISASVLDEIIDVLLENACQHGAGSVEVTIKEAGDALALNISDQGPGFTGDPEIAFARGHGSGEGIGLALARSLAHSEGALLRITLPGPAPMITVLMPRATATPATTVTTDLGPGSARTHPADAR